MMVLHCKSQRQLSEALRWKKWLKFDSKTHRPSLCLFWNVLWSSHLIKLSCRQLQRESGFSGDLSLGSYPVYLSNSITASDLDLLPKEWAIWWKKTFGIDSQFIITNNDFHVDVPLASYQCTPGKQVAVAMQFLCLVIDFQFL